MPTVVIGMPVLLWSGNFVIARAVIDEVPPVGLAFWRWAIAFAVLLPFTWRHVRRDWPVIVGHWRILLAISFVGVAVFNTMIYWGLQSTTAINGLLIQSAMPVMIVIISFIFMGERVTAAQALGIGIALCGATAITVRGDLAVLRDLSFNGGDIWIATAIVCYAVYSTLVGRRPPINSFSFLTVIFGAGAVLLVPLLIWEGASGRVMPFNQTTVLAVGYLALFAAVFGYLFYNRSVELLGANKTGLIFYLMPLLGSLMAVAFLGEAFRAYHAAGMVLILSGVFLVTRRAG